MQNGLFNVTEEQQSLVELIRDFMTKEIKPHVLEWEKEGHYPQEIIEQGIYLDNAATTQVYPYRIKRVRGFSFK